MKNNKDKLRVSAQLAVTYYDWFMEKNDETEDSLSSIEKRKDLATIKNGKSPKG